MWVYAMTQAGANSVTRRFLRAIVVVALLEATAVGTAKYSRADPCGHEAFSRCKSTLAELAAPSGRPSGILGPKDRREPNASGQWPWSSIGRVNLVFGPSHRGLCTGTLTGARQVVTAAHCLFNTRVNDWAKPHMVHFVVGQAGEKTFGHSMVASFVVSPDFKFRVEDRPRYDVVPTGMIRHDWAILTLRDAMDLKPIPIRSMQNGELPTPGRAQEVALAGYGVDRQFVLSVHRGCSAKIGTPDAGSITHMCDSMPGQSGGPILLLQDGNASLFGILSGTSQRLQAQVGYQAIAGLGVSASEFEQAAADAKQP